MLHSYNKRLGLCLFNNCLNNCSFLAGWHHSDPEKILEIFESLCVEITWAMVHIILDVFIGE